MTLSEFFDALKDEKYGYYLVKIRYKYLWDEKYEDSIEIMQHFYVADVWLDDWHEGQQDVIIDGYISIEDAYDSGLGQDLVKT